MLSFTYGVWVVLYVYILYIYYIKTKCGNNVSVKMSPLMYCLVNALNLKDRLSLGSQSILYIYYVYYYNKRGNKVCVKVSD